MARNLRLTEEEAIRLGLISSESPAPAHGRQPQNGEPKFPAAAGNRRPRSARTGEKIDPQRILAGELKRRLGAEAVQEEVTGLIPGRKYRVDILLPASSIIVEFDGFQYHRSKSAFQKDRERQNHLVMAGYRVLRYFNRQVHEDLDRVAEEILEFHRDVNQK